MEPLRLLQQAVDWIAARLADWRDPLVALPVLVIAPFVITTLVMVALRSRPRTQPSRGASRPASRVASRPTSRKAA